MPRNQSSKRTCGRDDYGTSVEGYTVLGALWGMQGTAEVRVRPHTEKGATWAPVQYMHTRLNRLARSLCESDSSSQSRGLFAACRPTSKKSSNESCTQISKKEWAPAIDKRRWLPKATIAPCSSSESTVQVDAKTISIRERSPLLRDARRSVQVQSSRLVRSPNTSPSFLDGPLFSTACRNSLLRDRSE